MNCLLSKLSIAVAISAGALAALPAHAESDAMKRAESRQMQETFTPQAEYQLSRREAHAAYQDALKACREEKRADRANCMRDAKSQLQQDLADAGRHYGRGTSMGASGTRGHTATGSDERAR